MGLILALCPSRAQSPVSMNSVMKHTPEPAGGVQGQPAARRNAASPAEVLIDPRVLVVDANPAILDQVRKILGPEAPPIDGVAQGQEGLTRVAEALAGGHPYAVALVDLRLAPGWDGIETIGQLWREDPDLQVVVCTDVLDHGWPEMVARLGSGDGLLVLHKPLDAIETRQTVHALSAKWMLSRELHIRVGDLERAVDGRTSELALANERLRKELLRLGPDGETGVAVDTSGDAVAESARTLRLAFQNLATLIEIYRGLLLPVSTLPGQGNLLHQMEQAEEAADLVTLARELPQAFRRLVGASRPDLPVVPMVKDSARERTDEHPAEEPQRAEVAAGGR
jgi:CheY-like chemotaxis protein